MAVTVVGIVVLLQPCISILVAVLMMALLLLRESKVLLPFSTLMTERAGQLPNALAPILSTKEGIITLGKEEQL